jgi:hypothetical protein
VVAVPVREQDGGERGVFGGQSAFEEREPVGDALAGVDEDALRAGADDVGVGALEGEL